MDVDNGIKFLLRITRSIKVLAIRKALYLKKELADEKLKNTVLNTMIDISDSQYGTQIRKKFSPKPSDASNKNKA